MLHPEVRTVIFTEGKRAEKSKYESINEKFSKSQEKNIKELSLKIEQEDKKMGKKSNKKKDKIRGGYTGICYIITFKLCRCFKHLI